MRVATKPGTAKLIVSKENDYLFMRERGCIGRWLFIFIDPFTDYIHIRQLSEFHRIHEPKRG
jgi:hypothetical protein